MSGLATIATLLLCASPALGALPDENPVPNPNDALFDEEEQTACAKEPEGAKCFVYETVNKNHHAILHILLYGDDELWNNVVGPAAESVVDPVLADTEEEVCALMLMSGCVIVGDAMSLYRALVACCATNSTEIAWHLLVPLMTDAYPVVSNLPGILLQGAEDDARWAEEIVVPWAMTWICFASDGAAPDCAASPQPPEQLLPPAPPFPYNG